MLPGRMMNLIIMADFLMNGFDTKVWFDGQAQWVMQQTDWETMDEVPPCRLQCFCRQNIPEDGAECHLGTVSQMAVHRGGRGRDGKSQTKYQILFTPTGEIIRARNVTHTYNRSAATFCNVCSHTC